MVLFQSNLIAPEAVSVTALGVPGQPSAMWPGATVTAGASGSGNGSVSYSVADNTGPGRSGTITIACQPFTITQTGICVYSISPTSRTLSAAGGTGMVSVTTAAGCAWNATSNAAWITVTGGSGGTGNGSVSYSVEVNGGGQRVGTITIANQAFTITQDTNCSYSISPNKRTFSATGGTRTLSVTSPPECPWTTTSNASWITVVTGSSGIGNGSVTYSVAANGGPQRSGTITIAKKTFTVTQSAGCAYTINPASQSFSARGGCQRFNNRGLSLDSEE